MKILVCGSGPLGSLFAARLSQSGHDVTLLARGRRLDDLRQHGIVLHDVQTDEWTTDHVATIERLAPDDPYDLALLMPSLAAAFYMCDMDRIRLAGTRDALVLALRAIREGFQVLQALGYPITPSGLRVFAWAPEPVLVAIFGRRLRHPLVEVALAKHARAARDEMQHLADEFLALARLTTVPTPAIDRLYAYFDPATPPMPEGSAEIPLDWRSVRTGLAVTGGALAGAVLLGWHIKGRQMPAAGRG